jgi:hypothetical protein
MTEPTQTVFDAVSAAIDNATPGASHVAPTTSESDDVLGAAADAPIADEDNMEGDALELEGEPAHEEGAKPETGDGKDAGADKGVDGKPGETPGAKPDDKRNPDGTPKEPAKVEPVKKAADPLNDPIPKELAKETQDRIRTLIKTTKENEAKATEATQQLDYIVNGVRQTGMNPQQYGEVLSFMQLFNSGDPKQQETALGLIENIADRLASLLGKERTTSDPLKNFPDLVAAVAQGQMTRAWAGQMASARRQQTTRSEIETTARTAQSTEAAYAQEKETARVDMNKWETETAAKDPQFKLLAPKLIKELKEDYQKVPPKEWLPRFQQAYRVAKAAAGPVRSTTTGQFVKGGVPVSQPLRARSSAAGGTHAPTSALDAMSAALASMK